MAIKRLSMDISIERNQITSTSRIFSMQMWVVLETIDINTMQVYCCLPHLNVQTCIEIGRWSTFPISRDDELCYFCSYNVAENEAHFVLECPLYNPIKDKFQSLLEKVVLRSLKSFFQLDHQVDVSLYLTAGIALRLFRELACLIPP